MNMNRVKRFLIFSGFIISVLSVTINGQLPNTMYFLPGLPQSNRINPSIQPGCSFYLGFPMAAPLQLQLRSSSLGYNDLVFYNADIDSLITPLHPLADKEEFLSKLKNVNYFLMNMGTSLASLGFRAGESFISLDISARADGGIYYPKGMFEFIFNGLANNSVTSFGGFGADINLFTEFSMGWSKKNFFIPNLDIGVRGKLLFGIANFSTQESIFDFSSSIDSLSINSHFQVNASAPSFVTFSDDVVGGGGFEIDNGIFNSPVDLAKSMLNRDRFGLALDLGASYRPLPNLLVSAALLDIGGITWNNTVEANFDFNYSFKGLEVNPLEGGIDTTLFSGLIDSVSNALVFVTGQPYFSALNTKLFIGASYYPIEKIGFGFLSRTDFLNQTLSQQFTGTVNMTTGKFANLSLSYSYISRKFNNIGAGFSFNVGPLNMYMVSDNLISGALKPASTRSVNLWFGLNLTFGWKKAEKAKKVKSVDTPLI